MVTMTAQVAKTQFGELLMKAQREPVMISKHGKPVAVMISAEDFEAWKMASLRAAVDEGDRDIANGEMAEGPAFLNKLKDELKGNGV